MNARLGRAYGRTDGLASGARRFLRLHELAIEACHERDLDDLMGHVGRLFALLSHEPDLRLRLHLARLYRDVSRAAHEGDFLLGEHVLTELHHAWERKLSDIGGAGSAGEDP